MSMPHDLTRAWQLHTQVQGLVEALPTTRAAQQVGAALGREGVAAYAHLDVDALARILKQLRRLHLALETGAVGFRIGRRQRRDPKEQSASPSAKSTTPDVQRLAAGPGLPGWGRPVRRSAPSSWRRPTAPIAYPYGEPPVPSPWRDDPPVKPHQSSKPFVDPYLARCRAEDDARCEALRRHGVPQYHGPEEPVTYVFREIE